MVVGLKNAAWVPQGDRFVKPADAIAEDLPKGFNFDAGTAWLKAIEFGENHALQNARAQEEAARLVDAHARKQSAARELGFADVDSAERARRFAEVPSDVANWLLAEWKRRSVQDLPDQQTRDPERRSQTVFAEASHATEKRSEERTRLVSVDRSSAKEEAKQYLSHQYTIDDVMICQLCKSAMPFKLDNGNHYFEAEPLLPELKLIHPQNHLALCPNHAAMFRYTLAGPATLSGQLIALQGNELQVTLAEEEMTLYFTKNHVTDLHAVLLAEGVFGSHGTVDTGD